MVGHIAGYVVVGAVTYYGASFVQTIFHWLFGHMRRIERIYQVHVRGHHAQYSGDMLAERWIPTEQHTLWYYAVAFVPITLGALWVLPLDIFAAHIAALAFAIWWHIYLHRQYHMRNTWWNRFAWFRAKQRLHMVHHRRPRKNYAIVEYCWDRLLGTFEDNTR